MFCRNCGKEIPEQAAVCTNCGVWVKENMPKQEVAAPVAPMATATPVEGVEKAAKLSKLFGILSFSMIAATMLFVFIGIAAIDVYGDYYYYEPWEGDIFAYAWLFSWSALGLGIVSFIFGLKTKKCMGVRYLSTLVFIMSILAYATPIFFLSM